MPRQDLKELSDDESESGSDIPAEAVKKDTKVNVRADEQFNGDSKDEVEETDLRSGSEVEEEESGDDNEASVEGEYVVETIRDHKFIRKKIMLFIKWKGWPEEDNTWEPEENLEPQSSHLLQTYYESIGGKPGDGGKKRKSTASLKESSVEAPPTLPAKTKRQKLQRNGSSSEEPGSWLPKDKDWEKHILTVDTVERDSSSGKLLAFLHFKNGKKTKVGMEKVHKHCPLAMLKFYEDHLRFK